MYEVYSVGNPQFLIEIFNGIARLWSTNDVYLFLSMGLLLGLIWNFFQWGINQDKAPFPAKGFIISLIMVYGFLGPNSLVDVRVISKRDLTFQEINNVPLLPALSGWIITSTGTALADIFSQAFTVVGVDNTWEAMSPLQNFVKLQSASFSSICNTSESSTIELCSSLKTYLRDCYSMANSITPGSVTPWADVAKKPPQDILAALKVTHPSLYTQVSLDSSSSTPVVMSCSNAYTLLKSQMDNNATFQNSLKDDLTNQGIDVDKVGVFLQQNSDEVGVAMSALDLAKEQFYTSVFRDYLKGNPVADNAAMTMFDAQNKRWWDNASKKELWMENVEVMQTFFEALIVFLTPFLGLALAISGNGLMAVGQYLAAWLFIQLWTVMLVLVNGFTAMAMSHRFTDSGTVGKNPFSLSSIDSQFTTAQTYISVSAMLYTFIPPICMFILYRGVHSFQGMMNKATADAPVESNRMAPNVGATVNNGAAAYGTQTSTFNSPTGTSLRGDNQVQTSMEDISVSKTASQSASLLANRIHSVSDGIQQQMTAARQSIWGTESSGSHTNASGSSTQYTATNARDALNAAAQTVQEVMHVSFSEAQKIIASGGADSKLSAAFGMKFGKTGGGVELGAALKASLGMSDEDARQTSTNFQKQLAGNTQLSNRLSNALSHIKTTSNAFSNSEVAKIGENANRAQSLAHQKSTLDAQSAALNKLVTFNNSMQSQSKLDVNMMANKFGKGSGNMLEELAAGNRELSTLMQGMNNKEILDGLNQDRAPSQQYKSLDDYFQQRTGIHENERRSKSGNYHNEARANALTDFINDLGKINGSVSAEGVQMPTAAEQNQNKLALGILNALSEQGINGAAAAAQNVQYQSGVLNEIGQVDRNYHDGKNTLGKQEQQNGVDINQGVNINPQIQSTNSQNAANTTGRQAGDLVPEQEANGNVNNEQQTEHLRQQAEQVGQAASGATANAETQVNNNQTDLIATNKVGEVLKQATAEGQKLIAGSGAKGYADAVFEMSKTSEGQQVIRDAVNSNQFKGMEYIANLDTSVNAGSQILKDLNGNKIHKDNASSAIALLSNDKVMGQFFDSNGNFTQLGSSLDGTTQDNLKAAHDWYMGYKNSGEVSGAVNEAAHSQDARESDTGGKALAYALEHGSIAATAEASHPGKVFGYGSNTEGAIQQILDEQNPKASWGDTSLNGFIFRTRLDSIDRQDFQDLEKRAEAVRPVLNSEDHARLDKGMADLRKHVMQADGEYVDWNGSHHVPVAGSTIHPGTLLADKAIDAAVRHTDANVDKATHSVAASLFSEAISGGSNFTSLNDVHTPDQAKQIKGVLADMQTNTQDYMTQAQSKSLDKGMQAINQRLDELGG
jgi:hypothetical protein